MSELLSLYKGFLLILGIGIIYTLIVKALAAGLAEILFRIFKK